MTDDIQRALGRLEGQLDSITAMLQENKRDHEAMSTRVGNLESKVNWATGVGFAAMVVIPYVLSSMGLK